MNLVNLKKKFKRADYLAPIESTPELALAEGVLSRPSQGLLRDLRDFTLPFAWPGPRRESTEHISRTGVGGSVETKGRLARGLAAAREFTHRKTRRQAERTAAAWLRSDEIFRSVFEQAAVGMALVALDGGWLKTNQKLRDLLGYAEHEMVGKNYRELTHADDVRGDVDSSRRLLNGVVESETQEKRFARRDGTYRWCRVTRSLGRTPAGEPECYIAVIEDIGERRRTEVALRESEERYRFLFDNNPQSMWVYDPRTFALLAVNDVATERYGYSRPEFLGMTINDIRPADDSSDARSDVTSADYDVLGAWRLRRKDSTLADVEISSRMMGFGDRPARLVIAHDISERLHAEAEQKRLQATIEMSAIEWKLTFDAIESPVLIFDLDGRLTKLNRAARSLPRDSESEHAPRTIDNLGANPLWQSATQLLRSLRTTRVAASVEARDESTGRTWQLSASVAFLPAADDQRMILVISETTRIVELQASLCRNETMSMLGSLVSGVAHEVRNPLFGISSTLDAYEACSTITEDDQRYLAVLRKEVNRLNNLMRDLLAFGQPPNRELKEGSVSDAIAKAIAACTPLARGAKVEIASEVRPEIGTVLLDPDRLPQVFLNLLENAVQHSPQGGTITLEVEQISEDERKWVICRVRDRGRGFDPRDLPRVFEPFFTRRNGGTGLGLSIVQKIVEEHEGHLSASNHTDGGALMLVRLPVFKTNQQPEAQKNNHDRL